MYRTWNPTGFDADAWTSLFAESGLRMFAFTTKHHEGFSMFDTRTRVKQRVRWDGTGGPNLESCDLAYSIMETPFRRDVVKELCESGRKRGLRIALYFSHPDWYDADFRPYADHPAIVPSAAELDPVWRPQPPGSKRITWMAPDPSPQQAARMMARHRAQLEELLTNYGEIQMLSLDQWLGPKVWPELRRTILRLRAVQPNVMCALAALATMATTTLPKVSCLATSQTPKRPGWSSIRLRAAFRSIQMPRTTRVPSGSCTT